MQTAEMPNKVAITRKERRHPLRDNAFLLFRIGLGYGSISFPKAIHYINQHMSEEITLNIISKEIYCNPIYLSQILKKETNHNFSDYLT
jgi:hypothetical protein